MLAASDGPDLDDVLTVLVRHEPDYVLVTVAGEVDFASAAGLRERLFTLATAGRPLVADLDRVSFIDAAGLGVLAGAARQAAAHGGSLRVVCARRRVRRLFGLTQLDQAVPVAASLPRSRWRPAPTPKLSEVSADAPAGARTTARRTAGSRTW
jgi:anti-sigma B factor antagonist